MSLSISLWPLVVVALAVVIILFSRKRNKTLYPPGPKPRPFVGNLFDVPKKKPWKVYRDWGKLYGDLIHLEVIGQHVVLVNSQELADEIFEKRSRVYSDRPFLPMLDLMGATNWLSAFLQYGEKWRMHRKVYQQAFRPAVIPDYQAIISAKANQFLSNLRQSPDLFATHTRTYAGAVILATVYGYDVSPSGNDALVDVVEKAARQGSTVLHPSAVVVNFLPFLRHLPLEFPIFYFQRLARETRRRVDEMRTVPYEFVKNSLTKGERRFSLLAHFLEDHIVNGKTEHQADVIKDALVTAYAAGAETTASTLENFFLAMALYPEIQKRAQRDLDVVSGKGQLLNYTDRSDLPYIDAILRETLRWAPIFPLGMAHAPLMDDTIDGYLIPKGSIVLGNIWAMTRDESVYPDPESFIPERFLTEDGTCNEDQMVLPFGFGRRVCAGRHFALTTIWTAMTSILLHFDIERPEDEEGKPIKSLADLNYADGIISHPNPFRCIIKPRTG